MCVSIVFLPHIAERVQVKVFFCFPASEVPTFVGSPDGRESRLAPEVPTTGSPGVRREFRRRSDCADPLPNSLLTSPVLFVLLRFLFLYRRRRRLGSSSRRPIAPSPPTAAPPRPPASFFLPPPPEVLPVVPTALPPSLPPSTARALVFFGLGCSCRWCGGDFFGGGDCARAFVHRRLRFGSLHLFRSRFKVLPWCSNPKSNVPFVLPLYFLPLYSSISLVCVCVVS